MTIIIIEDLKSDELEINVILVSYKRIMIRPAWKDQL